MDCCTPMPPSRRFLAVRRVARLRADYLASKPNISASRVLACTRPSKPAGWRTGKHSGSWSRIWICSFMTSSTWTGPPAAHGRVQPADSGQPARAVPHGQKGPDPNAADPRTERRSRRAGGGFRHAAGGSGARGRHRGCGTAALTAMGRASTASSDRRTLAENPIRRSVWRNSRLFSRPGARRDCPCGLSGTRESVLEHAEIFTREEKRGESPETFSLPSPILP